MIVCVYVCLSVCVYVCVCVMLCSSHPARVLLSGGGGVRGL